MSCRVLLSAGNSSSRLRFRLAEAAGEGGPFSARRSAQLDQVEAFPEEQCALLDQFGLPAQYVPRAWGGQLDDHEELLRLLRVVASHDLSVVVAHAKTYLGAVSVWVAGEPNQSRALATQVLAGAQVSWALSERAHGADLLAGELSARRERSSYRLDGEKWPINNVTRCSHVCVLARTDPRGGNRGYSLFLVEKARLAAGTFRLLPKVRTHGIRGIDISGIAFDGARVDTAARVGAEGTGAETVLRALQLTRTMCSALSLGAGEHALRLATPVVCAPLVGRRSRSERSNGRVVLARCAALLIATDAAAVLAARSIQTSTAVELSTLSVVVKALAPTLVDSLVGELVALLGLRALLTDGTEHGALQKLQRDHHVVAIFDGSTVVTRHALISQLPRLARGYLAGRVDQRGLAASCRLETAPGPLDFAQLALVSRGGNSALAGLRAAVDALAASSAPRGLIPEARAVLQLTDALHERAAGLRPSPRPPMVAFELAAAYELCFAAAACVHLWAANAPAMAGQPLWNEALWVRACLRELRLRLSRIPAVATHDVASPPDDVALSEALIDWLAQAVARGEALTPFESQRDTGHGG